MSDPTPAGSSGTQLHSSDADSAPRPKRLKTGDAISRADDQHGRSVETTLFVSNLHCPSCVNTIEVALFALEPRPSAVSPSIVSHSVTLSHDRDLTTYAILTALEESGFEIHSAFQQSNEEAEGPRQILSPANSDDTWEDNLEVAVKRWRQAWRLNKGKEKQSDSHEGAMGRRLRHAEQCPECQAELRGLYAATESRTALCSTSNADLAKETGTGAVYTSTAFADSKSFFDVALNRLGDADGYGSKTHLPDPQKVEVVVEGVDENGLFEAELSIVGMTCSACVGSITSVIEALPWVRSVNVALLTNSALCRFEGKEHAKELVTAIEDAGFDASLESVNEVKAERKSKRQSQAAKDLWKATYAIGGMTCSACVGSVTEVIKQHAWVDRVDVNLVSNSATIIFQGKEHLQELASSIRDAGFEANLDELTDMAAETPEETTTRTVSLHINGMYCHHCPAKVLAALDGSIWKGLEIVKAPTFKDPYLTVTYAAAPPELTIRSILAALSDADPALRPTIYHPPTIEDKSRELQARERRRILFRLGLSVSAAVPAFIIGVVCMSLLKADDPVRTYVMAPMWAGTVSRAEWALFILATPIYFFAADTFHRKAIKEVKVLWRPGSRTPILQRFTRFGSMNMLMSLGTTIAYFSSIAELIMAATEKPDTPMDGEKTANSSYFDSVIFLTMFLLVGRFLEAYSKAKAGDAVTQLGSLRPTEALLVDEAGQVSQKLSIDLLDVGDVVCVPHGTSPPFDGTLVAGSAAYDESSLTGESKLVSKAVGDTVYSGTMNKGGPTNIRLTGVGGKSMLDQIIKVVREGQTRRAPIERAADLITSHFVPVVVLVGVLTWVVWLALGESGALPADWLDVSMGGWALWSLRFAIAVFVIACPCGIGLAAPTALFVGGGMAAKHGILVKGGGEAFQEASSLDCIVFDKTGTLTEGGAPTVTDYRACSDDDEGEILGMAMALERLSNHPVAGAVVRYCQEKEVPALETTQVEEIPGMGMKGAYKLDKSSDWSIDVECLVGNERLMEANDVDLQPSAWSMLQSWKKEGKSVVLVALRAFKASKTKPTDTTVDLTEQRWTLSAIFAIADAIRPESLATVEALRARGISVWMLSGDNPTTARAVAAQVGIHPDNVIAGVLPAEKADKIQHLQRTLPHRGRGKKRATVAMVGDGVNDSPALTMADVGIAVGGGSDVAISSAEFVLVSSDLRSMLTLVDLSRAVFRRVWFNFGWALVYNCVAMPVAAGLLYPIRTGGGGHVRLDPVWASLAMALSSVSVVTSSLLLRSGIPVLGFREKGVVTK